MRVGDIGRFYLRCIPSILVDNDGCGHLWEQELRYVGGDPYALPPRTATCPSCDYEVALAGCLEALAATDTHTQPAE